MAFPTIPTTGNGRLLSQFQANTTATRTFPSLSSLTKNSGDLLIAIAVAYRAQPSNATFSGWTGGFTELTDLGTANATDANATMAIGIATKTSTGSETGMFAVTQAATVTGHVGLFVMSIEGWHGTTAPEVTALATGTAAAADPAALSPSWGAADTLWISVGGVGETSTTGSWTGIGGAASPPTNYGSSNGTGESADVVGAIGAGVAFRQNNTSSEDVGPWGGVDTSNARNCALLIAIRPVPGQTIDLGQPSETETSQAVTYRRAVNAALVSEVESAQLVPSGWDNAATWNNSMPWNHPTLEPRKLVVYAQVTETETAQPVTVQTGGGQTIPLELVTETETSQTVTLRKAATAALSAETETSQPVTVRKTTIAGQPAETETSQAVIAAKTETAGLTTETESAQPVTVRKAATAGQPAETELAQSISVGGIQNIPIGQAAETETTQPVVVRKIVRFDDFYSDVYSDLYFSPVETEITQPVTLRLTRVLGQASETETAQTVTPTGPLTFVLGQAVEAEAAPPVTVRLTRVLGQPTEGETAQSVITVRAVTLGEIVETETALALTVIGGAPLFTVGAAVVTVTPAAVGTVGVNGAAAGRARVDTAATATIG